MDTDTERMLADAGWEVECQSPLELRHPDGSFASGQAAQCVIAALRDPLGLPAQAPSFRAG